MPRVHLSSQVEGVNEALHKLSVSVEQIDQLSLFGTRVNASGLASLQKIKILVCPGSLIQQELDLSNCSLVTDEMVMSYVRRAKTALTSLKCTGCPLVAGLLT